MKHVRRDAYNVLGIKIIACNVELIQLQTIRITWMIALALERVQLASILIQKPFNVN